MALSSIFCAAASISGVSADTDGWEYGFAAEAALTFMPWEHVTLEPGVSLGYTRIAFDDVEDAYGKTAAFDNLDVWEMALFLKTGTSFRLRGDGSWVNLYAKPAVVRVESSGGTRITGLRKTDSLESGTYARLEGGANIELNNAWSLYAAMAYTFGSSYRALSVDTGLNYRF